MKFLSPLVSVTIDDGWKSAYTYALPLLKKHHAKATFYVITGAFDEPHRLSRDQVRRLASIGHEIGAHTRNHLRLENVPSSREKRDQIVWCQDDLSDLGILAETFAYPYGEYDETYKRLIKEEGFTAARSVIRGYNDRTTDKFLLRVQGIRNTTSIEEMKGWVDEVRRNSLWLILMFHQIDYSNSNFATTPELFDEILSYINLHWVEIDVVKNIAHLLG
ncbi:MAG TPA: polysaccharide deacetylase family protein [Candidatus Paceibacterota bacterium]|jgi:peptidoglycan/xylan/chitin deacetylase (PgdA/CDA1 family)|nr:polysaccharide deacetylase family protein [Candidatus Paceibacterota bacterium]